MKTKLYNEQEEDYYFFGKIKCKLIEGLRGKKNSFFSLTLCLHINRPLCRLFTGCDLVKYHESMESSHRLRREISLIRSGRLYILFEYFLRICPITLISKLTDKYKNRFTEKKSSSISLKNFNRKTSKCCVPFCNESKENVNIRDNTLVVIRPGIS